MPGPRIVIFTDLDGCLLDTRTYSWEAAAEALRAVREKEVPLVFCSSKTRSEQEVYRARLGIRDPFIVEDGAAIYIEWGYFPFVHAGRRRAGNYDVVELGASYASVRTALAEAREETGLRLQGYADLGVEQVARATGLSRDAARRAMAREYQETIVTRLSEEEARRLGRALAARRLRLSFGGRFHGVSGGSDKGRAARILIDLFRRKLGGIRTVGIGDGENDLPLLSCVQLPVLVQKPSGAWQDVSLAGLLKVDGAGPIGWNRIVTALLS